MPVDALSVIGQPLAATGATAALVVVSPDHSDLIRSIHQPDFSCLAPALSPGCHASDRSNNVRRQLEYHQVPVSKVGDGDTVISADDTTVVVSGTLNLQRREPVRWDRPVKGKNELAGIFLTCWIATECQHDSGSRPELRRLSPDLALRP